MQKFEVSKENEGQRLDFVVSNLVGVSRAISKQLIGQGAVKVNNIFKKASYSVQAQDSIMVDIETKPQPKKIDFKIIYEDDDCVVIEKPVGILSHSKGAYNNEYTVSKFIEDKLGFSENDRTGIVHRLDRATSGVMVCAKNELARAALQKQFSNRNVKKTYYAVIKIGLEPREALIDMPIERNPKDPKRFRAGFGGRNAITKYEVKNDGKNYSLIELKPETGRTHQLRVHLAKLGFPIVGDDFYGGEVADRLFLHASELEITTPDRQRRVFKSSLPMDFINKYQS
jgi:23S rRNA pseudouridine1911/1915/1917 synthase